MRNTTTTTISRHFPRSPQLVSVKKYSKRNSYLKVNLRELYEIRIENLLQRLAFNARYLHLGLDKLGFITYGHYSSPIVPLLVFNPGKMILFHRMMKERAVPVVVVVVAYPATALVTSRVRFCVSASHIKEDIDCILRACDEIGNLLDLKHGLPHSERWTVDEIADRAVELVNAEIS